MGRQNNQMQKCWIALHESRPTGRQEYLFRACSFIGHGRDADASQQRGEGQDKGGQVHHKHRFQPGERTAPASTA